ncbi:MAG TPA: hypothetical protein P5229_00550 [Candidatus Gracilibacteria bacterium]|nr:hypothetical protein [Candidatus Gracilibacteria bacterium]HRY90822.1 hypothetical protein [Candidatus Gracilibacteria bacterium]
MALPLDQARPGRNARRDELCPVHGWISEEIAPVSPGAAAPKLKET